MLVDPRIELTLLAAAAAVLIIFAVSFLLRLRTNPAERERRRRLVVDREGKTTDGTLAEAEDTILHYSYMVAGVTYDASQDVSSLRGQLPADPGLLVGHVRVKYTPRNPTNSIVLCENWSGLRTLGAAARASKNQ